MNSLRLGFVKLEWVRVAGTVQHISDFVGTRPCDRPQGVCPECDSPVVMRLGPIRRPHVAHRHDADCQMHDGESALHANAKHHLAEQLRNVDIVSVREPCTEPDPLLGRCGARREARIWATGWDSVVVEPRLGSRRPDVMLFRNGTPVAAIEVYVSHAVDADKRSDLEQLAIPWVEVAASTVIQHVGHTTQAWTAKKPLDARAIGPGTTWTCGKCRRPQAGRTASAYRGCRKIGKMHSSFALNLPRVV